MTNPTRRLPLGDAAVHRIREFHDRLRGGDFPDTAGSKSDYWKAHSAQASVTFLPGAVEVSGASGFYIPPDAGCWRARLRDAVHRLYKTAALSAERRMRLAEEHSLSSLLTYDLAYDFIMRGDPSLDRDDNRYCFDPALLRPEFRDSRDLRARWFLRNRFYADGQIIRAAYYHTLFAHFLEDRQGLRYLEIGAGSGNLASFFRRYQQAKVTIVDLPETLLYSACYLSSIFPDAALVLPHEADALGPREREEVDFTLLLPGQTGSLPDDSFDVAVNVASFQEMTPQQVSAYFGLVQRVCRPGAVWCNVNRVEKFPSKDDRPTRACDFPYAPNNEVLVDQVDRLSRFVQPDPSIVRIERVMKRISSGSGPTSGQA